MEIILTPVIPTAVKIIGFALVLTNKELPISSDG